MSLFCFWGYTAYTNLAFCKLPFLHAWLRYIPHRRDSNLPPYQVFILKWIKILLKVPQYEVCTCLFTFWSQFSYLKNHFDVQIFHVQKVFSFFCSKAVVHNKRNGVLSYFWIPIYKWDLTIMGFPEYFGNKIGNPWELQFVVSVIRKSMVGQKVKSYTHRVWLNNRN